MIARFRPSLALFAGLALAFSTGCNEPSSGAPPASSGRYRVHAIQSGEGPLLVRFDTATGALEHVPLAAGRKWQPLGTVPSPPRDGIQPGRYSLDYFQAPSIPLTFVRTDTRGGQVWRMRRPRDLDWTGIQPSGPVAAISPTDDSSEVPRETRPPLQPTVRPAPSSEDGARYERHDVESFRKAIANPRLASHMRAWATEQLAGGPADAAVPALLELLEDEDSLVARSAVRALSKLEDPRVVPALEAVAKDHDEPAVRRVAENALATLR